MTDSRLRPLRLAAFALVLAATAPAVLAQGRATPTRTADYIVAVVNQELVTASELQQRLDRVRADAARSRAALPPDDELRRQVLDRLIEERVQISYARDSGQRIDEAELDRAVNNVAQQNQITPAQLRDRLREQGLDYARFRGNLRDQLLAERVREREVQALIRVNEIEIDALLDKRRSAAGAAVEYNIGQILVGVPEGADATVVAERRARAESALARLKAGEDFAAVAAALSDDVSKARGGALGLRTADRLPDLFVEAVRPLKAGELVPAALRSPAGFHVLKLIEKKDGAAFTVTQTRARHILLRTSAQLSQDAALRRLAEFKRQIQSGAKSFEVLARDNSEDGSASQGGDLGWAYPGTYVPEFDEAMNALQPGGISDPVVSRFGVHLIQVVERRQVKLDAKQEREQARNMLREQKFEDAYAEWIADLRARAYIEMREPPQ